MEVYTLNTVNIFLIESIFAVLLLKRIFNNRNYFKNLFTVFEIRSSLISVIQILNHLVFSN